MVKLTVEQIKRAEDLIEYFGLSSLIVEEKAKPGKNGKQAPPGETGVPDVEKRAVRYDKHRDKDNGGNWKEEK